MQKFKTNVPREDFLRNRVDDLYIFSFGEKSGISEQSFGFTRRENIFGQKISLVANEITMTGADVKMFVDRGNGAQAVSPTTLAITKLGNYIAEIEKFYDLRPQKDGSLNAAQLETLLKKDPNAHAKYLLFRQAQNLLRTEFTITVDGTERKINLLKLERTLDPNNVANQEYLKSILLQFLNELRATAIQIPGFDRSPVTSDHSIYYAERAVEKFQWPVDAAAPTRFRKLTTNDQLLADDKKICIYDLSLNGNLNATERDNVAHCIATLLQLKETERQNFTSAVKKITPSTGIGLPGLPDPLTPVLEIKKDDGMLTRLGKVAVSGIARGIYAVANLAVGGINAGADLLILAYKKATKKNVASSNDSALDLDKEAKVIADNCLQAIKNFRDEKNTIDVLIQHALTENIDRKYGALSPTSETLKKLTLSKIVPRLNALQYEKFISKNTINPLEAKKAQESYDEKFADVFQTNLKNNLIELAKKENSTADEINAAIHAAEKATHNNDEVKKLAQAAENAFSNLHPSVLKPQSEQGPAFLRASLTGNVAHIASTITSVFEEWGRINPVRGTVALGAAGLMAQYTLTIAAHHACLASAEEASKLVKILSATKVFPAFYHGVMPAHAGEGMFAKSFTSLVNGLVLGKATYLALSLTDTAAGREGYPKDLLRAVSDYPIEAALIASSLYAMGHGAIELTHETGALGNWKIFDELTAAIKPAAVIFDMIYAGIEAFKKEHPSSISPALQSQFNSRMAALLTNALLSHVSETGRAKVDAAQLQSTVQSILNNIIDVKTGDDFIITFKREMNAAFSEQREIIDAFNKQFPAERPAQDIDASATASLAKSIYDAIPAEKRNEKTFMSAFAEVEMMRAINPEFVAKNKDAVVQAAVQRLSELDNKFLQEDVKPIQEKKGFLKKLGTAFGNTLVGTILPAVHGVLGAVVGTPIRFIAKRLDVSHKTMRKIEKWSGYDNFIAMVDGVRALATTVLRLPANISRTIVTAAIRISPTVTGTAEKEIVGAGIEAAREFTAKANSITKRPDDVSWYRASMCEVKLVAPESAKSDGVALTKDAYIAELNRVVKRYEDLKGATTISSPLIRHLRDAIKRITANSEIQSEKAITLSVLKTLFPDETITLNEMLAAQKKIPAANRDDYMLASLQRLFREEMLASQREHTATYKAFTHNKNEKYIEHILKQQNAMLKQLGGPGYDNAACNEIDEMAASAKAMRKTGIFKKSTAQQDGNSAVPDQNNSVPRSPR
ncbi:MAG TPA: hypothetical protein VJK30_06305 [Coxiellaceae bacterium]|nr:MAG: hypothetical protein A3E81_05900 [Gammaproteobacteria bacterium RIFCSPHIGHO2_12_FULL_36_30]HLB56920.1 hypothetical protein [Coxiellaceae bacterium]